MNRLLLPIIAAAALTAFPGAAVADPAARVVLAQGRAAPPPPADDDDPVEKCGAQRAPDRVVACLRAVLAEAEKGLDAQLKAADAKILKADKIPAPEKAKWKAAIAESQAAWRRFVELDCDGAVAREAFGEPTLDAVVLACKATHVRARVADLENRFTE